MSASLLPGNGHGRATRMIHGSGEMAGLIRKHPWGETPLGVLQDWRAELVASVNHMLGLPFPAAVVWGGDYHLIYNDAYRVFVRTRGKECLGLRSSDVWHEAWPHIGPMYEAAWTRGEMSLEDNVLIPVEHEGKLRDYYWTNSISPIHALESEAVLGAFNITQDRTAAYLAARERDAAAERLRQVLDATTDSVMTLDRSYRITYMNRQARKTLEASGDVTGRVLWELYPEAVYAGSPYLATYHRAMEERIGGQFEAFYPGPLNMWFSVEARPYEEGIAIFFRDITQQRMEADALRESEARLSAIYSTSIEYIGLLSPDGTILDCNRASLQFAGSVQEELQGMHFWDGPWFAYTEGAPEQLRQAVAEAAQGTTVHRDLVLTRPDGEKMTFDFCMSPVRNAAGEVIFLVPEGHDISKAKRTEQALMQSEKLAAVGRLAASIAHEINNPLESVTNLLYLSRLTREMPEIQQYLDLAERELRRVTVITNQTLGFNKQAATPINVDCEELIESVLNIYHGRLVNSRVKVERRRGKPGPLLCFDGEVRQVLSNLVGNAIEAMQPGGGRLLVRSRGGRNWRTGENGVVTTVADTGPGMDRPTAERIFDAFYTTKGTRGNGLGLWISQEIVQRHRGTLRVRSSQLSGRSGTVFTLFLPNNAPARLHAA